MNNPIDKQEVKIRQGKGTYIFKKDWEEGHDPSKPYIEVKDDDGNLIKKKPISKSYNVYDMKEEDLNDFLGEDEKKAFKEARKQRKEIGNRDICKEYHEKKKKNEDDKIKEKDNIIEAQNTKINELQAVLTQHNQLLAQIVAK